MCVCVCVCHNFRIFFVFVCIPIEWTKYSTTVERRSTGRYQIDCELYEHLLLTWFRRRIEQRKCISKLHLLTVGSSYWRNRNRTIVALKLQRSEHIREEIFTVSPNTK